VSFATGLSVVTLNIHHRGMRGREVPMVVKKVVFGFLAKMMWIHLDPPDHARYQPSPEKVNPQGCDHPIKQGVQCNLNVKSHSYSRQFLTKKLKENKNDQKKKSNLNLVL
jgi:hypothetical protein